MPFSADTPEKTLPSIIQDTNTELFCTATLRVPSGRISLALICAENANEANDNANMLLRIPVPDFSIPVPDFSIPVPDFSIPVPLFSIPVPDFSIPVPDFSIIQRVISYLLYLLNHGLPTGTNRYQQ